VFENHQKYRETTELATFLKLFIGFL